MHRLKIKKIKRGKLGYNPEPFIPLVYAPVPYPAGGGGYMQGIATYKLPQRILEPTKNHYDAKDLDSVMSLIFLSPKRAMAVSKLFLKMIEAPRAPGAPCPLV